MERHSSTVSGLTTRLDRNVPDKDSGQSLLLATRKIRNFGKDKQAASLIKYYKGNWRTYQLSDHKPMWVRIKSNAATSYLAGLKSHGGQKWSGRHRGFAEMLGKTRLHRLAGNHRQRQSGLAMGAFRAEPADMPA